MLQNLKSKIPSLLNDPSDPDKYQRNLIKLEVYYEEFNFEKIEELPAYLVSVMFSIGLLLRSSSHVGSSNEIAHILF